MHFFQYIFSGVGGGGEGVTTDIFLELFLDFKKIFSFMLSFTDLLPQQVRDNAYWSTWRLVSLRL